MTMTRTNSIMLASAGVALVIAAHGLVAWGGITLSAKTGAWLPWIGGGAVAFGLYHIVQVFGAYHVVRHFRRGSHRPLSGGLAEGRAAVERGPHHGVLVDLGHGFLELTVAETDAPPRFRLFLYDKRKQARPVPRNASITVETVRSGDERQTFDFHSNGEYLESTTDVPTPYEFTALVHVSHGGKHRHTHEVPCSEHEVHER